MVAPRDLNLKLILDLELSDQVTQKLDEAKSFIQEILEFMPMVTRMPVLGDVVHYRGKEGVQALRAAIVSCTLVELDPQNVVDGNISDLDDEMHVHLHVITPGARGHFEEFNIDYSVADENGNIPPGTWTWPK